ncbi:MAG: hypothetical protein A2V99_13885 [Spirochaetes bacterium RBG_16_67_19]|nr:MAG: hypothetical protein A2V99_13885 [Spirochaetes bacterium RBG_16_67_19]
MSGWGLFTGTLNRLTLCSFPAHDAIRHRLGLILIVSELPSSNVFAQVESLKTILQFALCLTRTEYQNGFRIPIETCCIGSLTAVIRRYLLRLIGALMTRTQGTPGLFFNC